jgi:hypothetical protein
MLENGGIAGRAPAISQLQQIKKTNHSVFGILNRRITDSAIPLKTGPATIHRNSRPLSGRRSSRDHRMGIRSTCRQVRDIGVGQ